MATETPGGYCGKILRVNLSARETSVEEPDENFYRRHFGGTGLIGHYLLKELAPGVDPLGPDNKLIFSSGVITGIPTAGAGRNGVGAKSPLTGGWGDAQAGGFWGAELKRAGWDAIIVEGQADAPVALSISDEAVEIRDAAHLWGQPTADVQKQLEEELGDKRVRVTQIGLGGEKLVRNAGIANDVNRYYGRSGLGAVMGSKKLKAIAVRGRQRVKLANADKVREIAAGIGETIKKRMGGFTSYGTPGGVPGLNTGGILPTRNFREGQFEGFKEISGQTMADTLLVDNDTCYACSVNCKRVVEVGAPYNVDRVYGGPEYETIGALGSLCGVSDLSAICKGNELCNAYGLDTIGVGTTIAFAMECFENGLITKDDTGGIELKFGNAEAMMKMVELIARREGLGDVLAEGCKRAAEKIGKGAEQFAMHVKGQELPMHEPRGKVGLGLGYTLSPTGADHMHNIHDDEYQTPRSVQRLGILEAVPMTELSPAKVRIYRAFTNWRHFQNSAVVCMFLPYLPNQMAELVEAATGWRTNVLELLNVGERALALARCFNAREGFTAKDDALPARLHTAFTSGPLADQALELSTMQEAQRTYYAMAGYDPDLAAPTTAKLHDLDLAWVIDALAKAGINT
jgi:aldehyde:ferredoxin oxidoreductase